MLAMSTSEIEQAAAPYHHGGLRRALIDAALDQLADGGLAAIGLRELARAVGVSSAAPYRHFKSRNALLAAVATEGFARFEATLEAACLELPENEHLAAMGQAYVRFALGNRALFRLMFSSDIDKRVFPELKFAAEAAFKQLAAAGARESRSTPLETAIGAWAIVHGLSQLLLDEQLLDLAPDGNEMLVRVVTNSFVAGLRANQIG